MPAVTRAGTFRRVHDRASPAGPLVIPNVWGAASARAFEETGFPALVTSSGAIAAVLGHEDGEDVRRTRCSPRSPGSCGRWTCR